MVTPDELYISNRIQRFMNTCKDKDVNWAIFSDKYGVWFKNKKNKWYKKSHDSVTDEEFKKCLCDFNGKPADFDEIWFYYNPGRFHKLYRKLLAKTELKTRVRKFTHLNEIHSSQEKTHK